MSTPFSAGHLPCPVGDQVVVRYATWWLGGGRSGIRTQPHWDKTRWLSTGPHDGPVMFPILFFAAFFKNIFLFTRFSCLSMNTILWETISPLIVKLFEASYSLTLSSHPPRPRYHT